jgi:hypothetical protein
MMQGEIEYAFLAWAYALNYSAFIPRNAIG